MVWAGLSYDGTIPRNGGTGELRGDLNFSTINILTNTIGRVNVGGSRLAVPLKRCKTVV